MSCPKNNIFLIKQAGKKAAETVKVIIRCRPMNEKEIAGGHDRYGVIRNDDYIG